MGLHRAEIHFQAPSFSSSSRCGVARDRDSLIAFRARVGCLSTHSVTEAVYRKFKLFRRTKSTENDGRRKQEAGSRQRERERERFSRQTDAVGSCLICLSRSSRGKSMSRDTERFSANGFEAKSVVLAVKFPRVNLSNT